MNENTSDKIVLESKNELIQENTVLKENGNLKINPIDSENLSNNSNTVQAENKENTVKDTEIELTENMKNDNDTINDKCIEPEVEPIENKEVLQPHPIEETKLLPVVSGESTENMEQVDLNNTDEVEKTVNVDESVDHFS